MKDNICKSLSAGSGVLLLLLLQSACMTTYEPMGIEPATLGSPTSTTHDLRMLPPPQERVYAAVYRFRDQTGQYKASSTGSSFSTAVTQGATSMLINALEESGWFIPVEREGLANLLNERKIIRSSRAEFLSNEEENGPRQLLPPLLFAGVLIEGGVVAYETNLLTGGAGARYLGIGASSQYRQDRVSVYLRAVSTQNGRVLKTVHTTKTILSQMVDANLFKFVDYQQLAEVEIGYSSNEPPQICVAEAIEKAVQALIIEGVYESLWTLKEPSDIDGAVFMRYQEEKRLAAGVNSFGLGSTYSDTWSLGVHALMFLYSGDYPYAAWQQSGMLLGRYTRSERLGLEVGVGFTLLKATNSFTTEGLTLTAAGLLQPFGRAAVSPYIYGGGGVFFAQGEFSHPISESPGLLPFLQGGSGVLIAATEQIDLDIRYGINYYLDDSVDGITHGYYNDYAWVWSAGVHYRISW